MSDPVVQTKIIYDDRFVKYYTDFYDTRIVHKPFLPRYIEEIIKMYDDDTIIHVVLYDHKEDNGTTYIEESLDILNQENVVVHIINPKSYYYIPNCPKIYYYVELGKDTNKKIQKLKELIEEEPNKDDIILVVCEDYKAITLNYSRPKQEKPVSQ